MIELWPYKAAPSQFQSDEVVHPAPLGLGDLSRDVRVSGDQRGASRSMSACIVLSGWGSG